MLENISMWSGVAAIIVSLIAVIILYLTRQNILDILDKDVILFSRNFEIKKGVIDLAYKLVDEASQNPSLKYNMEFQQKARECYNQLISVLSDAENIDEFYMLTMDPSYSVDDSKVIKFKMACRKDIGLSNKHSKATRIYRNYMSYQGPQPEQPRMMQNSEPIKPIIPTQPIAPAQPDVNSESQANVQINEQRSVNPVMQENLVNKPEQPTQPQMARPMNANMAQPRPTQPQPNPVQPRPVGRPAGRPAGRPVGRPASRPVGRPAGNPNSEGQN